MKRFEKNLRGLISRSAASDVVETVPNEHLSEADARELDNALEAYLKARAYLSSRTDEYLRHLALD